MRRPKLHVERKQNNIKKIEQQKIKKRRKTKKMEIMR